MPKNAYFGHYPSPNLIIVPTVNLCHPPPPTGWGLIADPITNSPTISCEQLTPVKDISHPSPYVSDCNHQHMQHINAETFFNNTSTPEFSDKFQNSPVIYQNTISTQASSSNIRQSIKELSSSKYQSNNNLVDLTGFNLLKKDSASSLSKRQHLKRIDDTKTETGEIKTISEKEPRYSDTDTCKSDIKTKGFAKNIDSIITNGEGNPENDAICKPEENTKDNMQTFHRQLWKHYIENFKDKAAKEKLGRVIKSSSNKKRQDSKELKHESCKSKAHSQTSSKKYREMGKRFLANYTEGVKTETQSCNLQDSKDKEKGLSSDAMQRYKDFKRFISHCDAIKYNENQLKTKSLPRKKIRDESCGTTNIKAKLDVKKKINESNQYIKNETHNKVGTIQASLEKDKNNTNIKKAIVTTNTDKALIKNIRSDRNLRSKISQRVGVEGLEDLRSKISRKRSRSDCFVHNQEQSVKQDVEAGSKNSPKLTPPINDPKAKKCKTIELLQNTKSNLSQTLADSGDINQDLPEDLSFLDDLIIHADEIVASLPRSSKLEHLLCSSLTMTTPDNIKSDLNKKISANGNKDNEETNPKKCLINYDSMESIEINKTKGLYNKNNGKTYFKEDLNNHISIKANELSQEEELSLHKRLEHDKIYYSQNNEEIKLEDRPINITKVTEINSDIEGEDMNFGIGSIAKTKKHEDLKEINRNAKNDRNSQHEENNTDMTEKVYAEIGPKKAMHHCKDKQKIIITITGIKTKKEANKTVDLTEKHIVQNTPKESTRLYKAKQKIASDSKYEIHIEQAKNMPDLTEKSYEENALRETINCNAKQKITTDSKYEINSNEEVNNVADLIENAFEENKPEETMIHCKAKQKITTISQCVINTNEEANNMALLNEKAYEENALKETCKAKQKITTDTKYDFTGKDYKEITTKETASPCNAIAENMMYSKYEVNNIQEASDVTALTGQDHEKLVPKNIRRHGKAKRKTNSEYDINTNKNKKHANYTVDLTGKDIRVELCDDSDESIVELIEITDDNVRNNTNSENLQLYVNRKFVINKSNKPNVNRQTDLDSIAKVLFRECNNETPVDSLRFAFEAQVKQRPESSNTYQKQTQSHKSADPFETTLQSEFTIEANKTINNPGVISDVFKQLNINKQINPKYSHVNVKDNNDNSQNSKDIVETMFNSDQNGITLKHSEPYETIDAMELFLETISNCMNPQDIGIYKPNLSGQPTNKEIIDVLKTAPTIEPDTRYDNNGNGKLEIELSNVDKHIKIETAAQESVSQILPETTKNTNEQNVAIQIHTSPINVSNIQENVSQKSGIHIAPLCRSNKNFKEQLQTFEYTSNILINDIEKTIQNGSENSSKETPETVNSDIAQNNEAKSETSQISEETIHTSSNTTIVTKKLEQKADSRIQSNKSDENVERKNISLKKSELIISEQSREKIHARWTRYEYKADVTTSKVTKPDRNLEDTLEKAEVETNTKKVVNESLVSDGRRNKVETKSYEQVRQFSPRALHYILKLESRMSEYLKKKYTISSVIHAGRSSTIYKCFDIEGGAYQSLKVVRQRIRGKFMEGVFSQLQRYRPRQNSCILYLMNAFEFQERWCLLTEYFPNNLEQVLNENKRGFHIDQVQVLSRQLVYAVNMLAGASIIHTDIKPTHILLNSAQDRLKLCGFDRSDYYSCIKITPSTGSPKYRAPEVILGFQANHRIDVWSTGLVIFEMATNNSLFNARFNNELLYEQLCTFGSFDWTMVEQSRYKNLHFSGYNFTRRIGPKEQQAIIIIHTLQRNENLRKTLFGSYYRHWAQDKSQWQITKETDKLETLHTLLEQMLALDPRHRLPIQFVNASEFMNHTLTIA